jgi:NADH-quinone oxidoreductase subunit J
MIPGLFIAFGALLVLSSLMVILHRNPVTSALFLVLAFCSLAGIYLVMHAEFIGMVQVIVYAGAIMVLFLFVIMYLNLGQDVEGGTASKFRAALGWGIGALLVVQGALLLSRSWAVGPAAGAPPPAIGNTQAIGQLLYSRYLFPFEITSLVLLVAMVGAIVITRGRGDRTVEAPPDTPPRARVALRPGDTLTPPPGGAA